MKVGIIGDFNDRRDEGLKNIAYQIADNIPSNYEVVRINVKNIFSGGFWTRLLKEKPDIIHYIPGPTIMSFVIVKLMGILTRAKTVMSAPQPVLNKISQRLIRLLKPTIILVQSKNSEKIFRKAGIKTIFLPNGVDTERFIPLDKGGKSSLRMKYGLEQDKFTVLHVGHIMPRRNLGIFSRIDISKYQSLIVASEYLKLDEPMYNQLKENGCKIITGYIKDLQEVYGMCDCYVFPVRPGQTVMMPLTVFEAMSCNMPVITTEFEALKERFTEGNGLIFVKDVEEILSSLESLKVNVPEVKTREMILPYSWVNIGKKIGAVYDDVIKERG